MVSSAGDVDRNEHLIHRILSCHAIEDVPYCADEVCVELVLGRKPKAESFQRVDLKKGCEDFLLSCNFTCIIDALPVFIVWELQQKPD
jgi:hypothetical protein